MRYILRRSVGTLTSGGNEWMLERTPAYEAGHALALGKSVSQAMIDPDEAGRIAVRVETKAIAA